MDILNYITDTSGSINYKHSYMSKSVGTKRLNKIGISVFRDGAVKVWPYFGTGVVNTGISDTGSDRLDLYFLSLKGDNLILSRESNHFLSSSCISDLRNGKYTLYRNPEILFYNFVTTVDAIRNEFPEVVASIDMFKSFLLC